MRECQPTEVIQSLVFFFQAGSALMSSINDLYPVDGVYVIIQSYSSYTNNTSFTLVLSDSNNFLTLLCRPRQREILSLIPWMSLSGFH